MEGPSRDRPTVDDDRRREIRRKGVFLPVGSGLLAGGPIVWLMLATVCSGCVLVSVDYAATPSQEAVFLLQPGRTTRDDVISRLGPPDEYQRPAAGERGRTLDPRTRHSLEEHRVFDRSRFTYAHEHLRHRRLNLLFFQVSVTDVTQDRLVLVFDDEGVLRDVSFERSRET